MEVVQQSTFLANTEPFNNTLCIQIIVIDNDIADGDRTFSLLLASSNPRVLSLLVQLIIEDDERKQTMWFVIEWDYEHNNATFTTWKIGFCTYLHGQVS